MCDTPAPYGGGIRLISLIPGRYSYRAHMFSRERSFWLEPGALGWSQGDDEDRIFYRDVDEVRLYRLFMPGVAAIDKKVMWRIHLHCRSGERLVLSPLHYVRFRSREDRSATYLAFANQLLQQLQNANPNLQITREHHWTMRLRRAVKRRLSALGGRILLKLFWAVRNRDPDRTADAAARFMRSIGPWLRRRHRLARKNLVASFPDKSQSDIEMILEGMWDNFGRIIAEYAFLDRLWDFHPNDTGSRRIAIDRVNLDRAARIREIGKPILCFGAHLANWEMPAVAAAALGVNLAVVYRPPDFAPIAKEILDVRARLMGTLIPAGSGGAASLKYALDHGMSVGMLVDQHFINGLDVMFFGRRCKVNPTLAQFARRTECAIHGARAIRLPAGRFRLEVTDVLVPPRDGEGKIEIAGTMQMITAVIESWVREHPEQWLWMHRRWR
jgi:KDO2-lipid IV(A) lauroyltransferase